MKAEFRAGCPVCRSGDTAHFSKAEGKDYRRCLGCCATFLDPRQLPSREFELDRYRQHRNDPEDPRYLEFLNRLARPLLERLGPNRRGLDYGCGPGPGLARLLSAAGHTVRLYDPLFRPDPDALGEKYDFVTCTEVAEHFHHPADEFARLDTLLHAQGWLGIMTRLLVDDSGFADWHYRRDPTHVVFYKERTFRAVAARMGWTCEFPGLDIVLMRKRG